MASTWEARRRSHRELVRSEMADEQDRLARVFGFGATDDEPPDPEPEPPDPEPEPVPVPNEPRMTAIERVNEFLRPARTLLAPSVVEVALVPRDPGTVSLEERATINPTLVEESADFVTAAHRMLIVDAETCARGDQVFDVLRGFEQDAHAYYDPDCQRAHALWKSLTDKRGVVLKPLETARQALGEKVATWKAAEKRRETEEQAALERQAREEHQLAAARAAVQAERAGDPEVAKEILAEAKTAPLPIIPRGPSRVPPSSTSVLKEPWKAGIIDLPALLKAIGDRQVTEFDADIAALLLPKLNQQVKTLKGEIGKRYPGVEGRKGAQLAGR